MSYQWYIGQDIVCVKSHSQDVVKEGDIHVVHGLKQGCCAIYIDVGISIKSKFIRCICGSMVVSNGIHWIGETLFAPLDSLVSLEEIEEVLSEPVYSVKL